MPFSYMYCECEADVDNRQMNMACKRYLVRGTGALLPPRSLLVLVLDALKKKTSVFAQKECTLMVMFYFSITPPPPFNTLTVLSTGVRTHSAEKSIE